MRRSAQPRPACPRSAPRALRPSLLLIACLAVSAQAAAQDFQNIDRAPTLSASDESLSFEYFASAALRPYPAFAGLLLRTAGETTEQYATDAARDHVEFSGDEYWRSHTLSISDQTAFVGAGVVSVLRGVYIDGGGAHPNWYSESWLWKTSDEKAAGCVLSLGDLFRKGAPSGAFVQAWLTAVTEAKKERLGEDGVYGFESEIEKAANNLHERPFTLAPSIEPGFAGGVVIHHAPYDIGPYAEGGYDILIPATAFEEDLSGLGRAIFRGEPARRDR